MNQVNCNQCGKPAIVEVNGNPLCVDCDSKLQQAEHSRLSGLTQQMNFLLGMAETTAGMPGLYPRYEVPQPMVFQGPQTFNNIHVEGSVVGSINTGNVKKIDVALDHIGTLEGQELKDLLQEFTQSIISLRELDSRVKDEILEQVSVIATQAVLPREQRNNGVLKSLWRGVRESVASVSSLVTIWEKIGPILEILN